MEGMETEEYVEVKSNLSQKYEAARRHSTFYAPAAKFTDIKTSPMKMSNTPPLPARSLRPNMNSSRVTSAMTCEDYWMVRAGPSASNNAQPTWFRDPCNPMFGKNSGDSIPPPFTSPLKAKEPEPDWFAPLGDLIRQDSQK